MRENALYHLEAGSKIIYYENVNAGGLPKELKDVIKNKVDQEVKIEKRPFMKLSVKILKSKIKK